MLTASTLEHTDVVEVVVDGRVDAAAMQALRERLTAVADEHGRVRLLAAVEHVGQIEPKALLEDLRTAGLLDRLERYALMTDAGWIDVLAKAGLAVMPVDGRVFGLGERDEALAWLTS